LPIDAKAVISRVLNEALGIDSTHEVVVQVASFRHVMKEGVQKQRLMPSRFQVARRALFRSLHLGRSRERGED
jgi:hypothetical protein